MFFLIFLDFFFISESLNNISDFIGYKLSGVSLAIPYFFKRGLD